MKWYRHLKYLYVGGVVLITMLFKLFHTLLIGFIYSSNSSFLIICHPAFISEKFHYNFTDNFEYFHTFMFSYFIPAAENLSTLLREQTAKSMLICYRRR